MRVEKFISKLEKLGKGVKGTHARVTYSIDNGKFRFAVHDTRVPHSGTEIFKSFCYYGWAGSSNIRENIIRQAKRAARLHLSEDSTR